MRTIPVPETLTVSQLIAILLTYPAATPVMATWEGIHTPIQPLPKLELREYEIPVLIFDVENY